MTRKSILKRQFLLISLFVSVASLGFWSCVRQELDETVQKAYELRMNGKADSAKVLLEQAISEDSTNALAHYELARTKQHMALGNPRQLANLIKDAHHSIERATEHDPDNVIYAFFAGGSSSLQAYISLQRGQPDAKEKYAKACSVYESVLKLKPDYHEAMLYLVEIYGVLPEDKGGDKSKAEQYAKQLEEMDEVFGAKAREILLPPEVDVIEYWEQVLERHEGNANVLERLGKAYLYKREVEAGAKCFKEAVRIDPEKNTLFLDLARYHIMTVMGDEKLKDTALPLAEEAINRYLRSEPIPPLEAYTLGLLAKVKWGMGDNEGADELGRKAEAMDPYHSKAMGVPSPDLFVPPGEISHNFGYFSRPF